MSTLFVLFESASGFALLEQTESDEIGQYLEEMQSAMCDLSRLSKVLKLKAFVPFQSFQAMALHRRELQLMVPSSGVL